MSRTFRKILQNFQDIFESQLDYFGDLTNPENEHLIAKIGVDTAENEPTGKSERRACATRKRSRSRCVKRGAGTARRTVPDAPDILKPAHRRAQANQPFPEITRSDN